MKMAQRRLSAHSHYSPWSRHMPAHQVGPDQVVVNATNVLAQTAAMPSGIPQGLLAEAQGIVIIPNMIRGAFVIGAAARSRRAAGARARTARGSRRSSSNDRRQLGIPDRRAIDRSDSRVPHAAERAELDARHAENRRRRVGGGGAGGTAGIGRDRLADAGRDPVVLAARGAFLGVSIDGSSISLDPSSQALYYQPPGTMPASATQLLQMVTAFSSGSESGRGAAGAADRCDRSAGPPPAPQGPPPGARPAPSAPPASVARRRRDAVVPAAPAPTNSKRRGNNSMPFRVNWRRISTTSGSNSWRCRRKSTCRTKSPSLQALEQAIGRYEKVANDPQFSALTSRPEFQETLKGLWRLGELQQGTQQLRLPPPPMASESAVVPLALRVFERRLAARYAESRCDASHRRQTHRIHRAMFHGRNTSLAVLSCLLLIAATAFAETTASKSCRIEVDDALPAPPAFASSPASIWCSTPMCRAGRRSTAAGRVRPGGAAVGRVFRHRSGEDGRLAGAGVSDSATAASSMRSA